MHLHIYVLTIAESKDDAESNVRSFVEDRVGEGRWFDYGDVDDEKEVVLLSEVRNELIEAMEHPKNQLKMAFAEFDKYRTLGIEEHGGALGYQARRISEILCQEFTDSMPFFNMEEYSWLLPENDDDGTAVHSAARESDANITLKWYAVPVDLHF